jgi:uncharacterized FlgJ-related protein
MFISHQKEKKRNLFIESIISHAARNFSKLASGYKSKSAFPDDLISIRQFNQKNLTLSTVEYHSKMIQNIPTEDRKSSCVRVKENIHIS